MKTYLIILVFNIVLKDTKQNEESMATLGVHDRVAILKWQIAEEMNRKLDSHGMISPIIEKDQFFDNYEYVDMRNKPITPIMSNDERKKHDKFKLKEIKTTTARDIIVVPKNPLRQHKNPRRKKLKNPKSDMSEVFYRRQFEAEDESVVEWAFCQDLIAPFVQGFKTDITTPKVMSVRDSNVLRLIQLLSINATEYTKEDIYSVLYQISNVQIRLFQWDTAALRMLFRTICPGHNGTHPHTLRDVQIGLKDLFHTWHLDIENVANLLKQTRLFRPPCMRAYPYGGSTKTSRATRYTKPGRENKCQGKGCGYK
ncbi:hypothetical protein K1T71_000687 [Dendrolimus kikuchii]|uniref:Uncharacterized protein n=1 Tax=Dendrolimus kikuchii TaxID=765133 RepID=A0ACC1DJW2_9NEOP|nr:hypothetical protein K1T71_000687 [Dendrolimus kikuchii]